MQSASKIQTTPKENVVLQYYSVEIYPLSSPLLECRLLPSEDSLGRQDSWQHTNSCLFIQDTNFLKIG